MTIQGWIKKYVRLMEGNLDKINLKHHTRGELLLTVTENKR